MSIRDEMVKCPFDESHRVSRARFPVHLIKCRKQHKGKDFSICPYNATHYVLTPEFQFHLDNCQDRKTLDLETPVLDDMYRPPANNITVPPPSESWDNEGDSVSYLDVKDSLIKKLPVLRAPTGMTKSERKKFMRREVHRFHNLSKGSPAPAAKEPDFIPGSYCIDDMDVDPTNPRDPRNAVANPVLDVPLPRADEGDDDGEGEFYLVSRRGHYRRANV